MRSALGSVVAGVVGVLGCVAGIVGSVSAGSLLGHFGIGGSDSPVNRVLITPDYTRTNPYQRNLVDSLDDRGIDVEPVNIHGPLMPIKAVRRGGLPDVLHLHWLHPFLVGRNAGYSLLKGPFFLVQVFTLRLLGVRIVWTVHNVVEHEGRSPLVERALKNALVRVVHSVIVHCDGARQTICRSYRLPERYAERMHVVPHGHYVDSYENDVSRADARDELGVDEDEFLYLYFGRIYDYKNVPGLIRAFDGVDDPEARLLVAGNPKDETIEADVRAVAAADDRVHTKLSFIPPDRIQHYMNAADVVVLPFREILNSGSAILAMSFGKPVIVPEAGCISSLIPEDGGFTYRGDGVEPLCEAMERAADAELESIGAANRRAVLEQDWERIGRLTAEAYEAQPKRDVSDVHGIHA